LGEGAARAQNSDLRLLQSWALGLRRTRMSGLPEPIDEGAKRQRQVAAGRIVQVKSAGRRAPVCEHSHESLWTNKGLDISWSRIGQADVVQHRAKHQLGRVQKQRPIHRDCKGAAFPPRWKPRRDGAGQSTASAGGTQGTTRSRVLAGA
jgi:hypothetical protein